MEHELKTIPKYFNAVREGRKTFEVRKDDRNFQVGDTLNLRKYEDGMCSDSCTVRITYILGRKNDEKIYVPEGYVILGIR